MARTHTFNSNKAIGAALRGIEDGTTSRFLTLQLVAKGFVAIERVAHEGRGRPGHKYVLTGKGRFAKNWGAKAANLVHVLKDEAPAVPVATGTALVVWQG